MPDFLRSPRHLVLIALPLLAVAVLLAVGPIRQSHTFYDYADRRTIYGIVNFSDVVSNLAFLLAGGMGLHALWKRRPPGAVWGWTAFFAGAVLVTLGSAHYHLDPNPRTLVWDRLPITIAFMAAFAALLGEYVAARLERWLLVPLVLFGAASVVYWTMTDDLALYLSVQVGVFGGGLWLLIAFDSRFHQKAFVLAAFLSYGAAIIFERFDHQIYAFTNRAISGHTLKHVLAALAVYWICRMLCERTGRA